MLTAMIRKLLCRTGRHKWAGPGVPRQLFWDANKCAFYYADCCLRCGMSQCFELPITGPGSETWRGWIGTPEKEVKDADGNDPQAALPPGIP